FLHLRYMRMRFQPVGENVFVRLGVAEIARAATPGTGDSALGVDHDPFSLDQAFLDERGQREQRGRRVAARIRQAGRAADALALSRELREAVGPAFHEAMVAADV